MDIKRRMIDKMSNVGRLVEKLQQKGFVERVENFNDRRVIFVNLTETGVEVFANIQAVHSDTMLGYFDNITEEESVELVRILEKMRAKSATKISKKKRVEVFEAV